MDKRLKVKNSDLEKTKEDSANAYLQYENGRSRRKTYDTK